MISVFTDGGARGNPGPAATGVHIVDEDGSVLFEKGEKIGTATNNVAEYKAVIAALEWLNRYSKTTDAIRFFLDSQLVCLQINGVYKVKNPVLRNLLFEIRKLEATITSPVRYTHIPREKNTKADALVNRALDARDHI